MLELKLQMIKYYRRRTCFKYNWGGKKIFKLRSDIVNIIKKINWKSGFYRRDIGWRVIKNENNCWKIKGKTIIFLKSLNTRP